jgi:hypothetical protein
MSQDSQQNIPQAPPSISTTQTFLLECSRSNSLIDKDNIGGEEENASWINQTGNFQVKKGDQVSIEMVALNLASTQTPIEFTGYNVILPGNLTKSYVDNRIVLEVGYYINNNQSYTNNLPLYFQEKVNNEPSMKNIDIMPMPDRTGSLAGDGVYPGYGRGFGHIFNTIGPNGKSQFQTPNVNPASYLNSYRMVGFTVNNGYTFVHPAGPLPAGTRFYSIILEKNQAAPIPPEGGTSIFATYESFLRWEVVGGQSPMYGMVGQYVNLEAADFEIYQSPYPVCDIIACRGDGHLADAELVQICFPLDAFGQPGTGGMVVDTTTVNPGAAMCFCTPNIRFNDIFRAQGSISMDQSATNPNTLYSQKRQNSGMSDFFTGGLRGNFPMGGGTVASSGYITDPMPMNLGFPNTDPGMTWYPAGGIGSANRLQGTDNLPYILTRNDYMGGRPKANCEKLGRYRTWTPDLQPLTSFIVLEAEDLLMDATALADKINEKLHASLPGVGNNSQDLDNYQTNIYGFTKRYKKSSQLLPFNNYEGYYPYYIYPRNDNRNPALLIAPLIYYKGGCWPNLTQANNLQWTTIDPYYAGGTKQIIPANLQPGFNKLSYIGMNQNLFLNTTDYFVQNGPVDGSLDTRGTFYPSFESTYLRTCKLPPDFFGDTCSWNNVMEGNMGVKDIYKHLWGDLFNRLPVWDGNTAHFVGVQTRNFNRPVILNSQLQLISVGTKVGGDFGNPGGPRPGTGNEPLVVWGPTSFESTVLVRNQMIFTNIYYNKESLEASEPIERFGRVANLDGDITHLLSKLGAKHRDYEIYINTENKSANTYAKQWQDITGYCMEIDLGKTDDKQTKKWDALYATDPGVEDLGGVGNYSCTYNWNSPAILSPALSQAGSYPSSLVAGNPKDDAGYLTPSETSVWFGTGEQYSYIGPDPEPIPAGGIQPRKYFSWNAHQNVNRAVGRMWIQSRYDPNWLTTSNTGNDLYYGNDHPPDTEWQASYPQLPQSARLDDTMCSFKDANGLPWVDDTWSKENDVGIYPYRYTDSTGQTHIFMAFRVGADYKAADTLNINSEVTNTWQIGRICWGCPFGFSESYYDNNCVIPMNPDRKNIKTTDAIQNYVSDPASVPPVFGTFDLPIQFSQIQNCNSYIAVGADNPTFSYNTAKSRMELSKTYKPTLLSSTNSVMTPGGVIPNLGEPVSIYGSSSPDAYFSPPGNTLGSLPPINDRLITGGPTSSDPPGRGEKSQNVRSEETGIYIYKVWLPDEDWNPPTDINLYSYWSNNSPSTRSTILSLPGNPRIRYELQPPQFSPEAPIADWDCYKGRDNQDGTADNRDAIIDGLTEATPNNYRGCLLDKLGFTIDQFLPKQGRQWNRYTVNGYGNPQPDLILTQNTKPFLLNNQSNLTLNPAFNQLYTGPGNLTAASGLPNYGLGFSNNLPVVVDSTGSQLTARNPIESTNSPFFQIYSTISPNHYLDNGQGKAIMFYCMKNYVSGNYSYGYGSTFAHTATTDYNLDYIQTEIRNPISGRLMKVLQPNSVITYKITRPYVLAPDAYDEQGIPFDPTTEPFVDDIGANIDQLFNIIDPIQGGTQSGATRSSAPPSGGEPPILPPIMFNSQNEVINLDVQPQVDADIIELQTYELSPFRVVGDISALEQKEMGDDGDQETKSGGGGFKENPLSENRIRREKAPLEKLSQKLKPGGKITPSEGIETVLSTTIPLNKRDTMNNSNLRRREARANRTPEEKHLESERRRGLYEQRRVRKLELEEQGGAGGGESKEDDKSKDKDKK